MKIEQNGGTSVVSWMGSWGVLPCLAKGLALYLASSVSDVRCGRLGKHGGVHVDPITLPECLAGVFISLGGLPLLISEWRVEASHMGSL